MAGKHPKAAHTPHPQKRPTFNQTVEAAKAPKIAVDPDRFWKVRPSWRLTLAQMSHPWGWHALTAEDAAYIREKLASFESRTWSEILVHAKKQNHHIAVSDLCADAQKRLKHLQIFVEEVVSLRLSGEERVFGLLEEGVFSILWWDPTHEVCESKKK